MNAYRWIDNGSKLEHHIDGDLRATVEREHLGDYIEAAGIDPKQIPDPDDDDTPPAPTPVKQPTTKKRK